LLYQLNKNTIDGVIKPWVKNNKKGENNDANLPSYYNIILLKCCLPI
jgi:hypothetical protein